MESIAYRIEEGRLIIIGCGETKLVHSWAEESKACRVRMNQKEKADAIKVIEFSSVADFERAITERGYLKRYIQNRE